MATCSPARPNCAASRPGWGIYSILFRAHPPENILGMGPLLVRNRWGWFREPDLFLQLNSGCLAAASECCVKESEGLRGTWPCSPGCYIAEVPTSKASQLWGSHCLLGQRALQKGFGQ